MTALYDLRPNHAPLRWWSEAELVRLAACIEAAVQSWLRAWAPRGARVLQVTCTLTWEEADAVSGEWRSLGARADARAWHAPLDTVTSEWLFEHDVRSGVHTRAELAAAVVSEAAGDLQRSLRAALQLDGPGAEGAPDPTLARPWSGAVRARLALHNSNREIGLLFNGAAAAWLLKDASLSTTTKLPAATPLVPLHEACEGHSVRLDVRLAPLELDLGLLASLLPGDIIPFPHSLDTPLRVSLDGHDVCEAFLGRRGKAMAIELIGATSPANAS